MKSWYLRHWQFFWIIWSVIVGGYGAYAQQPNVIAPQHQARYKALQDSIKAAGQSHEVTALYGHAIDFFVKENPNLDSAQYYAQRCADLATLYHDSIWIGKSNHKLSYIALRQKDYTQARQQAQKAVQYFRSLEDSASMYLSMVNLGVAYHRLGQLDRALKLNLELAQYYENHYDIEHLILSLNNIGLIYQNLDNLDKAKQYYERVIALSDTLNDPEASLNSLQNLANIYSDEEKYRKALVYYFNVVEIATLFDNTAILEKAYTSIGYTYYCKQNYTLALSYANKAIAIAKEEGHFEDVANNLHTIGMTYVALEDFKQAEHCLQQARAIAQDNDYITDLVDFEEGLYQLYERTGDYQKALAHYQNYIAVKDKINGSIVNARISDIEADFLAQEKKLALLELQQKQYEDEKKLRRTITYVSTSLAVVILLFIVYFQHQKVILARNQRQLIQNKYDSLRAQMNPHFIFNTINGVQHHILKSDKLKAYRHLTLFAETLRLIIKNADRSFISLKEELALLERYIELERVRFACKFTCEMTVEDELLERNPMIPSMLIQPIVENAIIHGLSNKADAGHLRICLGQHQRGLSCTIEDNGIGRTAAMEIKQARINQHLSVATENTRERIALLKKFGYKQSSIVIKDLYNTQKQPSGTCVHLQIPTK